MSDSAQPIGVLGGGAFGTTLAHLVGCSDHDALLWMRNGDRAKAIARDRANERYLPGFELSARIATTTNLAEVAERCRLILVAIPSTSFRTVVRSLGDSVRGDHVLVSATKGLERGTFARMTDVLREETCCLKIGAISGPNLAVEILKGVPGGTVIASAYEEVVRRVEQVLHSPRFRVYASRDLLGVELGGAIKNVLAIAGGIARGMGFGDNTLSLLIARGLNEMSRLGARLGANVQTFSGLAGVGDLVVTAFSELSRNHRVGLNLAKGKALDDVLKELGQAAEGVPTARVVKEWADAHSMQLPICLGVYEILYENASPQAALEKMLSIPALWEVESTQIQP
ncbi:MAG: NAD(P)H-dependent glycerol-3-phosphate dehydrogenase [bacterium]